jgi:hypothetical protein
VFLFEQFPLFLLYHFACLILCDLYPIYITCSYQITHLVPKTPRIMFSSLDIYGCIQKESCEPFPLFFLSPSCSAASPDRKLIMEKTQIITWIVWFLRKGWSEAGRWLIWTQLGPSRLCFRHLCPTRSISRKSKLFGIHLHRYWVQPVKWLILRPKLKIQVPNYIIHSTTQAYVHQRTKTEIEYVQPSQGRTTSHERERERESLK